MLICSPQLSLNMPSSSGGEVYDCHLISNISKLGVRFLIILPEGRPCFPIENAKVIHVPVRRGRYANLAFGRAVFHLFHQYGFDILRVHSPRYVGLAAFGFRLAHPKVPIVVHHHHLDPSFVDRQLLWLAMRYCDALITVSNFSRQQILQEVNGDPRRIHVVYNGVSELYKPQPISKDFLMRYDLSDCDKIVLSVSALKARKNLPSLLRIFKDVRQQVRDAHLVIVGDGPLKENLKALTHKLSLTSAVTFTGYVSEEEKIKWLNAATVFVSTSVLEGFGLSVAEGMACGKPAVVSQAGGLPEVVAHGKTGFVVPLGNYEGFVRAIVSLLRDRDLREEMGFAARERVEQLFSWSKAAEHVKGIYEEALNLRKRSRTC